MLYRFKLDFRKLQKDGLDNQRWGDRLDNCIGEEHWRKEKDMGGCLVIQLTVEAFENRMLELKLGVSNYLVPWQGGELFQYSDYLKFKPRKRPRSKANTIAYDILYSCRVCHSDASDIRRNDPMPLLSKIGRTIRLYIQGDFSLHPAPPGAYENAQFDRGHVFSEQHVFILRTVDRLAENRLNFAHVDFEGKSYRLEIAAKSKRPGLLKAA